MNTRPTICRKLDPLLVALFVMAVVAALIELITIGG